MTLTGCWVCLTGPSMYPLDTLARSMKLLAVRDLRTPPLKIAPQLLNYVFLKISKIIGKTSPHDLPVPFAPYKEHNNRAFD